MEQTQSQGDRRQTQTQDDYEGTERRKPWQLSAEPSGSPEHDAERAAGVEPSVDDARTRQQKDRSHGEH